MTVNQQTQKIEMLVQVAAGEPDDALFANRMRSLASGHFGLLRPNGEPVPPHWPVFSVDELVVVKGCTLRVAHINESGVLLEPADPVVKGGMRIGGRFGG